MPSVEFTPLNFNIVPDVVQIPFIHNSELKIAIFFLQNVPATSSEKKRIPGWIWNTKQNTVDEILGFEDPNGPKYRKMVDYNIRGTKAVVRIIYGDPVNNSWVLSECEIDFSALTGSRTTLATLTTSDDPDIGYVINQSNILSSRLALMVVADKPYIWYVDPKDFSIIDKIDTGFNTYNPRVSWKYIIKPDDIYVLLGRHLSDADFYYWKVYGKSATVISGSNTGGSPMPSIGNYWVSEKEIYLLGSSRTVVGVTNSLAWFDTDFNLLGKTSLTSIYSTPYPYGLNIVGKNDIGNLILIGSIGNAHLSEVTRTSIVLLEVDPTDFSLVNFTRIHEFTDMDNAVDYLIMNTTSDACRSTLPVIDKRRKVLYTFAHGHDNGLESGYTVKIDFSDIEINEWNLMNRYVESLRNPTDLTLSVRLL